jgi:hypothetical protein
MKSLVALALSSSIGLGSAAYAAEDLTDTARKALIAYTQATLDGPKALAPMLAPEFQIMRSNGVGYDRDGYLGRSVARISAKPDFSHEDIVATRHGDIMVARYFLRIDEVIEGKPIKRRAPRLTVFRLVDGAWKVVAHSNFGAGQ